MGSATFLQTSFAGGEWSAFNHGRMEHPWYRKGMAVCENGFPLSTGAWVRRPGTQHAAFTRNGAIAALIPFSFEDNQPYTIELTDSFLRFFQGAEPVLDNNPPTVSDISTATPAVVTVSSAVDWATGNRVRFKTETPATKAAMPSVFAREFSIQAVSDTTFSLFDGITGAPIDGSTTGWSASAPLTVGRVSEVASLFTEARVSDVRAVQNETDMVLLHTNVPPQQLTAEPPGNGGSATFSISEADFVDGPYLDPVQDAILTPSSLTGLVSLSLSVPAYVATTAYEEGDFVSSSGVTYVSLVDQNIGNTPASSPAYWEVSTATAAVNDGAGFTAQDYGRHIRLYSEPAEWVAASNYSAKDVVKFDNQYWVALVAITGAAEATGTVSLLRPGVDSTKWAVVPSAARWTWGKIVAPTSAPTGLISQTLTGSGIIGGLSYQSNAFDGITDVSGGGGGTARKLWDIADDSSAFIGRSFAVGTTISSAIIYPTNDQGLDTVGGSSGTLRMYGSNTAPGDYNDGTLLGSVGFNATTQKSPLTIQSNSGATTYKYVWIDCHSIPSESYGLFGAYHRRNINIAEIEFYDSSALAGVAVTVQILGDPLLYTAPITTWRLGLFNARDAAYPTNGCYHEGRLWLTGSVKNRIDASKSNEFLVFSPTESDGSVPNNAAISYTFNSSDLNTIHWMVPDLQGIVCGTKGGEWLVESPSSSVAGFAPTNIRARRVTKYGSAKVEPQRTGLTTVFVQRYKRQLHEFLADAYSGKLIGPEMAELNRAAVAAGVEQIAYQQGLVPIVWSRLGDGSLSGATYRRTSMISTQPPDVLGWHRHTLGSGRTIESICVGPSVDGLLDTLSLVTYDAETGLRQVEVLSNIFDEDKTIFDAAFVDGAVVPALGTKTGNNIRFHGLWPLNGKTVSVWAAGIDCGDFQVQNGYVDVPLEGLFTYRWLTQLSSQNNDYGNLATTIDQTLVIPAIVGFTYTSRGQVLRPVAQDATGSALGPAWAKLRREASTGVLMHSSQGASFGTNFEKLRPALFRTPGDRAYTKTELWSGLHLLAIDDGYTFESQLCWEVKRPYPLTITAIGGNMVTEN